MFFIRRKEHNAPHPFAHRSGKRKAIAFVDYEHWYISMNRQFSLRPDIRGWRDMISENYDIISTTFFADFSNPALREEIPRLREVSSRLIDTQNPSQHHKKDFTDFIMLDSIYQSALSSGDTDTFIIFTGDGHFNSVVSFLRTNLGKEVIIYGVKDATSSLLKNSASSFTLLPSDAEIEFGIKRLIIRTVIGLYNARKNARPTFMATADAIASEHSLERDKVTLLMNDLISEGALFQIRKFMGRGKYIKLLRVNESVSKEKGLIN